MKLRLVPIILAFIGSSAIFFGGWFIYHSVAMESPLHSVLSGTAGVEKAETDIGNKKVVFDLKLTPQADLREIIAKIKKDSAPIIGDRELEIHVDNSGSTPELEAWWSGALFDVAQAMETRHYNQIPFTLQEKAGQVPGLNVQTEMDDANVYVRLTNGEHSKFIILPRTPAKLGVPANE